MPKVSGNTLGVQKELRVSGSEHLRRRKRCYSCGGLNRILEQESIVEISRMTESIAQRILGKDEKLSMILGGERRRMEFAAGRFVAKEAFVKALGRKDIEFLQDSVFTDEGGRPTRPMN